MSKPTFGAVQPDNVRPRRARRDPDADTPPTLEAPAAVPAPAATAPPADPPSPAPPPPAPAAAVSPPPAAAPQPPPAPAAPAAAVPAGAVARAGDTGGTLADVLTAPNHAPGGYDVPQGVAALASLASMRRRQVDPMQDWVGDGTRTPRWLSQAIRQYAMLTGRKTQDVARDALLGVEPIPVDVLDANWLDCYGYPREQYDSRNYR